jgi:Carboxypeptidase regulatory-like domain/TonB dependent receptor
MLAIYSSVIGTVKFSISDRRCQGDIIMRKTNSPFIWDVFVLSVCLVVPPLNNLNAQTGQGTLTGTVTDATGSVTPGVSIKVVNAGTGVTVSTTTDAAGLYNIGALNPGEYQVVAEKTGFEKTDVQKVTVSASQTATVDIQMRVGTSSTTVTIAAVAPLINSSTPEQATSIEHQLVENLPYSERSSLSAAILVAGVTGNVFDPDQVDSENPGIYTGYIIPGASLRVGGALPGRSALLVDGSDVTQTSFPRAGTSVSAEMVQETTVITGAIPAQYGATQGGAIVQATRSGSNQYHGSFTWRHTDPALNAFPLGGTLPSLEHQNFFGGYAGGPVWIPKVYNGHNRTFFYVGVEPARLSNQISGTGRMPTPEELAGNFADSYSLINTTILSTQGLAAALAAPRTGSLYYQSAVNSNGFPVGPQYTSTSQYVPIPNNNVSAQLAQNKFAQYLISQWPTPQNPGPYFTFYRPDGLWLNNGNNVAYTRGVSGEDNRFAFRIDHDLSNNDRMFARYTDIPVTSARFLGIPPSSPASVSPSDQSWAKNFAFNEAHLFTPALVNEIRLMYIRNFQLRAETGPALSQDWAASFGLTPAVLGVGFPGVSTGYTVGAGDASGLLRQKDENYQFADDVTWTHGRHTLKAGADIRHLESNQSDIAGLFGGSYSFSATQTGNGGGGNALASLMLGLINSFTNTPVQVPEYYRWHYYAGYIQDDFKFLPNLTINLGVRYEVETPRMEKYNNQGVFIPSLTGTLNGLPATGAFCFSGACGLPTSLWPTNYKGVEPRVGVAWAPNPRLSVRAGYDILRVPLSGYGNIPAPDFNVPSASVGGITGGVTPNQPVNFITNPVGPLTSALSALQGSRGPFFTVQGITVPFITENDVTPYTQQFSLTVQYQFAQKTMLQVGYNGMIGTHLITSFSPALNFPNLNTLFGLVAKGYNFNAVTPNPYGIKQNGSVTNENQFMALLPYQNFFNQNLQEQFNRAGTSSYNALYVSLTQRYQFGLSLTASFAWSKSIDTTGGDILTSQVGAFAPAAVQSVSNLKLERAVSAWDIPAKFTTGFTYDLPFGPQRFLSTHNRVLDAIIGNWKISGVQNVQSGQPFAASLGSAGYWVSAGGGTVLPAGITLRPNLVPGQTCINPDWRANPFGVSYINPNMFSVPGSLGDPGYGDAPRTLTGCRSPRVVTFNANLFRRIPLGTNEARYLEIGVNALNVFNHPVFFLPGNSDYNFVNAFNTASLTTNVPAFTTQSSFGNLSPGNTEGLSRVVQLSVKLHW